MLYHEIREPLCLARLSIPLVILLPYRYLILMLGDKLISNLSAWVPPYGGQLTT